MGAPVAALFIAQAANGAVSGRSKFVNSLLEGVIGKLSRYVADPIDCSKSFVHPVRLQDEGTRYGWVLVGPQGFEPRTKGL